MARRRTIQSVIDNFLASLVSRNSELDGYWIFGHVVSDLTSVLEIDLLGPMRERESTATAALARLAVRLFHEQLAKQRLPVRVVAEANLCASRSPSATRGSVNGHEVNGFAVTLTAHVVSDLGRTYSASIRRFVAPHDESLERRSGRAP